MQVTRHCQSMQCVGTVGVVSLALCLYFISVIGLHISRHCTEPFLKLHILLYLIAWENSDKMHIGLLKHRNKVEV